MATAKKKTSAKRPIKYAAKSQAGTHATSPGTSWVNSGAADWQKGAQDWAKQSAKLYQLPFAQADMGAASQHAAESVKSAAENMVKMGNDMMQQMFGSQAKSFAAQAFNPAAFLQQLQQHMPAMPQMPSFDPAAAQEKLAAFARETSDQISRSSQSTSRAAAEAVEISRENIAAAVEVCNVAVTVIKQLAAEMVSYANRQFGQNVELSKQVLTCRTLNDMFDLSTRVMKSNLDAFFSESVKVSEMIFQCATDVSEPLNERVSDSTDRLAKAMAA